MRKQVGLMTIQPMNLSLGRMKKKVFKRFNLNSGTVNTPRLLIWKYITVNNKYKISFACSKSSFLIKVKLLQGRVLSLFQQWDFLTVESKQKRKIVKFQNDIVKRRPMQRYKSIQPNRFKKWIFFKFIYEIRESSFTS